METMRWTVGVVVRVTVHPRWALTLELVKGSDGDSPKATVEPSPPNVGLTTNSVPVLPFSNPLYLTIFPTPFTHRVGRQSCSIIAFERFLLC